MQHRISEEVYRQVVLQWKREHPEKRYLDIKQKETIDLEGIGIINIGSLVCKRRSIYNAMREGKSYGKCKNLTEEQISWDEEHGMIWDYDAWQEKVYREAILQWKEEHPEKRYLDIKYKETIELNGIGIINIGVLVHKRRGIYKAMQEGKSYGECKNLTEEQINWDEEHGMIWDYDVWQEEVYRQAILQWKKEHPEKKYLDIRQKDIVELESLGEVRIGNLVSLRRKIYKAMQQGKSYEKMKNLTKEQITWDEEHGMIWDYEDWQEKVYREAILQWKREHLERKYLDIRAIDTVELDGIGIINIGTLVHKHRSIYKAMQEGKRYRVYNNLTEEQITWDEEQGMIWDYEVWQEDVYRQAILQWKEEHPEKKFLDIKAIETVELEGIGIVRIGRLVCLRRGIYKAMQEGGKYKANSNLTEDQITWDTEHGMIWDYQKYQEEEKKRQEKRKSSIEKYTNLFNGDTSKAERVVRCLEDLREKRRSRKKQTWSIDNILKEFDVDEERLLKQLGRVREQEKERKPVLMKGKETLRKFCMDNGYNYEVIARAVKLHQILPSTSLEEVMNRAIIDYNHHGQKRPSTWIYEKYGNLVKHILTNLNLDSSAILRNMTENVVTLEEAIRHDSFLRCRKNSSNSWLEEPFNYLVEELDNTKEEEQVVEDIVGMGKKLIEEYHLTREEFSILVESFGRYANAIRGYQMYDVGLETNEEKRLEKIKDYNMPEEDIEESFFVPLNFENGVLLGRQSELYQRRNLMRQYIIDWKEYSDSEKVEAIRKNQFTTSEVEYMERTRRQIDKAITYSKK